ncbi:uncharacterized protein LOC122504984 [Leptopilina heterotoma]|uniref:uncharacterized protein LOC122504984 n=1 Tax=Leptopilina heterotoma TaxID=63436 RepID=UPI001CA7C366|nr:uncharacterized protein LOC122504984 [Leptopilina heterotoma]
MTQNDSSLNKNTQPSKNQNLKRQLDSNDAIDQKFEQFFEIEDRLGSKLTQIEKVMEVTLTMHARMQDSMKMWLDQREKDLKAEANRLQAANKTHSASDQTTVPSVQFTNSGKTKFVNERCYECDEFGHMKNECPLKRQGLKKCYECQQFTTHKAFMCPQRLARQGRGNGQSRGRGRGITVESSDSD